MYAKDFSTQANNSYTEKALENVHAVAGFALKAVLAIGSHVASASVSKPASFGPGE